MTTDPSVATPPVEDIRIQATSLDEFRESGRKLLQALPGPDELHVVHPEHGVQTIPDIAGKDVGDVVNEQLNNTSTLERSCS